MAVTNLYSNLPGHLVEFKDGGLQLTSNDTNTSSTKSLLILGTAFDGPINEPVKIDAVTVSQLFGKEVNEDGFPNGATLTKYAKQAFKNGFDDVRCMRVTGSQPYTSISGEEEESWVTERATVSRSASDTDNGKIVGNDVYTYNTLNQTTPVILAADSTDVTVAIQKTPGAAVTEFPINTQGISWIPYKGFEIPAGKFAGLEDIKIKCPSIMFFNGSGFTNYDSTTLVSKKVYSESAHEDSSTSLIDPITVTLVTESGVTTSTTGVDGTLKNKKALIFNDSNAYMYVGSGTNATLNFPQFNLADGWKDGFLVEKVDSSGSTPVRTPLDPTTDYTISIAEDTTTSSGLPELTVTFDPSQTIVNDADTIEITYFPYLEGEFVIENFLSDITYSVPTLDISSVASKKDLTPALVTITKSNGDTIEFAPSEQIDGNNMFSFDTNTAKIVDTRGLDVGDTFSVTYTYKEPITRKIELKIKSQFGGKIYKDGKVRVDKVTYPDLPGKQFTEIVFTKPASKQTSISTNSFSYSSRYYPTIDDIVLAMKNDVNNLNLFDIEIVEGFGSDKIDILNACPDKPLADNPLTDQELDGVIVTANDMFKALSGERYTMEDYESGATINPYSTQTVTRDMVGFLKNQGAYQILENYNVDYIYPAGVYADMEQTVNPYSDFQRELALVCAVLTYRTKMTHGFIDVKPNSNTTLVGIDAYVSKLVNGHKNIYYMTDQNGDVLYDSDNKPMDIGWYTSIVVGPEVVMTSDTLGTYYGSPAIAYAALNSVLEPQSAPTNKALRNVNGIKFKFSNKQMDALCGSRMVCFRLKNEGLTTASSTPYVVDGMTAGAPNCDYSRMVTVKVLTDVVDQIREVADPFIGEQNTTEQRNALSALISKRLSKLVELGEILSYEFEVSATIQQQLLGEASIALTIVPAMELRKITTVVALRAAE